MMSAPQGSLLLGNLTEIRQDFLGTLARWHRQHGDLVPFRLGAKRMYLVSHPALAEEMLIKKQDVFVKHYNPVKPRGLMLVLGNGLVTSSGSVWKKQRRMMQPMFARSQIALLTPVINGAVAALLQRWEQGSGQVELCDEMLQITLEVITRSMFSLSVQEKIPSLAPAMEECLIFAQRNFFSPFAVPLWLPSAANQRFKRAKQLLNETMINIIQQRRASTERHGDLLDILLNARDEETGEAMSEQQIIDEVLTIFTAGHETTANALSWCFYLLSQHPEARHNLQQELTQVLQGRAPSFEDVANLPYTRAVFDEALRLYPPAVSILRRCAADSTLGDKAIPKGAMILVNLRNIHRHPELWPDADQFKPERFMPEQRNHIPRLAFMPFGIGPRACIGNQFAMVEGVMILAHIAQHFNWQLQPDCVVEEQVNITLRPKHGLRMQLMRR